MVHVWMRRADPNQSANPKINIIVLLDIDFHEVCAYKYFHSKLDIYLYVTFVKLQRK